MFESISRLQKKVIFFSPFHIVTVELKGPYCYIFPFLMNLLSLSPYIGEYRLFPHFESI